MFEAPAFHPNRANGSHPTEDNADLQHVAVVPDDAPDPPPLRGSARWWYVNEHGNRIMAVDRFEPRLGERKLLLPLTLWRDRNGRLLWKRKQHPVPRPLFHLDRLAARPGVPLLIVEGEKKVAPALDLFTDVEVTCSAGGGNAARLTDWSPCLGRQVIIWPDHDEAGAEYAQAVTELAKAAGASSVSIVQVPENWPTKWDLAEPLPDGVTQDRLRELLVNARPVAPRASFRDCAAEVSRLARLHPIDYDRERKTAAERLGIRSATLDEQVESARKERQPAADHAVARKNEPDLLREVKPWPEPVDAGTLCGAIARDLARFVSLPSGAATAITLWCLYAHACDAAEHGPVLAIQSAEKRCGKTTLLSIVLRLVPTPLPAANISPAALFRAVEKYRPTLLIDEADSFLRDNEDMRGVLNSGFTRATAYVIRCDGEDLVPTIRSD